MNVDQIRRHFRTALMHEDFTIDRTGAKTIELIGASFIADEPAIFGNPNNVYIDAEIKWYESEDANVNTLGEIYGSIPKAWAVSANKHGEVNSNYGKLIFSKKYYNQFKHAVTELLVNPDSRRAQIIYNRPSMWLEYNEDGKNDFICTNAQSFYIRDGKLHMVSQMRSNDVVYGYMNDYSWARSVQNMVLMNMNMARDRDDPQRKLEAGDLIWQVMNLHVYERHFKLVVPEGSQA